MLKIFCNKKEKDLKDFWSHIVFHPTNAIEDDWGQAYLNKIAEDKAVKSVRIYSMFEESVTLDENGNIQYDWSKNDFRIDYLLEKGFDIVISYGFIPPWLSAEKDEALIKPRYKNTIFYRSYCADCDVWGEICRAYTEHIVERYGEDTVANWYLNCYNEPDLGHFFYWNAEEDYIARAVEYNKLYEAFEKGVTSVSRKLKIGGCALSQSQTHLEFLEEFLKYVKANNLKLDFLSYHSYGGGPSRMQSGERPFDARGAFGNTFMVKQIADACGFKNIPLLCDEWGGATDGYYGIDKFPILEFRENELYSAYFVKMLSYFDESGLNQEMLMLCLSGQHNLKGDLLGHRNFFSKSFYPKPIYNAFVLGAKLGGEKLYYYTDNLDDALTVMPTKHSDGHMSHLFAYADPAFRIDLPTRDFTIEFDGLDKEYKVVKYVIDKTHANCYTKFCELGRPQDASEEIKEEIRKAGTLVAEDAGTLSPENSTFTLNVEKNAVVLLELFPA